MVLALWHNSHSYLSRTIAIVYCALHIGALYIAVALCQWSRRSHQPTASNCLPCVVCGVTMSDAAAASTTSTTSTPPPQTTLSTSACGLLEPGTGAAQPGAAGAGNRNRKRRRLVREHSNGGLGAASFRPPVDSTTALLDLGPCSCYTNVYGAYSTGGPSWTTSTISTTSFFRAWLHLLC